MHIQTLLSQAHWRLRAYWHSDDVSAERVGWRDDPALCPVAEWLDHEATRGNWRPSYLPSVHAEEIVYGGQWIATPPLLAYFIDLVDGAMLAADRWQAGTGRVSREEALAALAEAERLAAQRLLPERCSVDRCAYIAPWGAHCPQAGCSPELFGFLSSNPDARERPEWLQCWPFYGRLCAQHQAHLVVPPASWWPGAQASIDLAREAVAV